MHSLQPQQNAQLRPRGHDENILEEAYRGRYARQRLLNFWPESSCGYHAIKRFVCIIQVKRRLPKGTTLFWCRPSNRGIYLWFAELDRLRAKPLMKKGSRRQPKTPRREIFD